MERESNSSRKSFALKILTLKSSAIKILQTLFANPAPRKPFRGREEGGYLESNEILPKISPSIALENGTHPRLFQANLHRTDAKKARS
jgi:hypothetical protein